MIDPDDYTPTTAVEAAHYVNGTKLAAALRQTAAVAEFCRALAVSPDAAVVTEPEDEPWDENEYKIEQLEEIGCRVFVNPPEEEAFVTQLSESSTGNTNETHAYEVSVRRQVLGEEIKTLGIGKLYTWFWSHVSALPQQVRLAADGCLIIKEFNCTSPPAFNSEEEAAEQGVILHAKFRVTTGDVEGG